MFGLHRCTTFSGRDFRFLPDEAGFDCAITQRTPVTLGSYWIFQGKFAHLLVWLGTLKNSESAFIRTGKVEENRQVTKTAFQFVGSFARIPGVIPFCLFTPCAASPEDFYRFAEQSLRFVQRGMNGTNKNILKNENETALF